jgi:MinD-like ATPase involved in chromosome partitioning or flagellar assembly
MSNVFAIFSTTGGVGVSTIAAHLAYMLAIENETAVVDMIPDFGSLNDFLGFTPKSSAGKFPLLFGPDSPALVELSLPKRPQLKILAMPPSAVAQVIDWKAFFASSRKTFTCVVLDLPHTFLAPELSVGLAQADQILAIGEYHWATVQSLKAFVDNCDQNIARKCKFIMNRSEWLPQDVLSECRQILSQPIFAELPYDPLLDGVRKLKETSVFAQEVRKLALTLQPEVKS